jgi:nucleotide-binding universal stress UspA family protein
MAQSPGPNSWFGITAIVDEKRTFEPSHPSPSLLTCVTAFRFQLRYKGIGKLGTCCRQVSWPETFPVAPPPCGEKWSRTMATAQLTPVGVGIHKVLIATDFSSCSNLALSFGLELAHGCQANAHVVFVVPRDELMIAGPEAYTAAKDAARRDLLELKQELRKKHSYIEGEDYQMFLLEGDVPQAILDFARQKQIDVIVVGTHGRGGLGRALMGSVAESVFRRSPVPVLTLGPHLQRIMGGRTPKNILVPIDFTPASERAARYATAMAREHNATLTMLHVIERWQVQAQADRARVMQRLREKVENLVREEAKGLRCSFRIEMGRVVETVLYTANGIEADLLVMGVRPRAGLLNRLMWPHAYEIVREATCPVLTVRGDAAER